MKEDKTFLKISHSPSEIEDLKKNDQMFNDEICSGWSNRDVYREENHLRINYYEYEFYFGDNKPTIKLNESDLYVFPNGTYNMYVSYKGDCTSKNENHPQIIQCKLKFINDDFNVILETTPLKPEFVCGEGNFVIKGTFDPALYTILYDVKRCFKGVVRTCKPWEY